MAKRTPSRRRPCLSASSSVEIPALPSNDNDDAVFKLKSVKDNRSKKRHKITTKSKKKVQRIDEKKPKKPPTAFFYYLEDFRKVYQELNPDVKSMREIGKACGEKWNTMTYEEKVQYYDTATEKRAEFDKEMAAYRKRQESGEDEECEDSEFDDDYKPSRRQGR